MRVKSAAVISLFILLACVIYACSKGGSTPSNPCTGVTVTVNGTTTNPTSPSATDGTINAAATGGSGITYSINGGSFQSSGNFTGLGAGSYTVTAKTADGCTGTRSFTLTAPNACTGVTITVTATAGNAAPCATPATGTITASATGSTGFTYSINGTSFQASGSFTGLAAGGYTVTAKDANGCTGTASVTVGSAAAGPLFTAVRSMMATNCQSCHNNTISEGGMNWTIDCNIVINKDRIKTKAVDEGSMPPTGPLSQTDKDKITNWINAGGRYTD